jgi:hypothetical protein
MALENTRKIYAVGTTVYTLDGKDRWECMSAQRLPGQPASYWFMNFQTGDTKRGTIEELPDFQEVECIRMGALNQTFV